MPRISHPESMLTTVLNDLLRDWDIAKSDWRDRAREQFEKEFIEEFVRAGRASVRGMQELTLLLRRVVRECS
jgi:hypothetical protein